MSTAEKILLVGCRGMLAHAIRSTFAGDGSEVIGVDTESCDITKPEQVAAAFDRVRPTLVINCAAYTNVDACEKNSELANAVNGDGVGNLARAAQQHDAAMVHFSTDYVFDGQATTPISETQQPAPRSAYGRSKLLGEQQLQANAPRQWLICRTAWLYGPNGPSFPATMLRVAREGKPLTVVSDQIGSPTFTFDLAAATHTLIASGESGIFHLTNSGQTSWFDFAGAIFKTFGESPSLSPITSDAWKRAKPDAAERPAYSVLSTRKYTETTGKQLPAWEDGLHRFKQVIEP